LNPIKTGKLVVSKEVVMETLEDLQKLQVKADIERTKALTREVEKSIEMKEQSIEMQKYQIEMQKVQVEISKEELRLRRQK
jgi:hypothetical protein